MSERDVIERISELFSDVIDLGIEDGHQIVVADVTTPKPVTLTIKYVYNME